MRKIKHNAVHEIQRLNIFENINSYSDMNNVISKIKDKNLKGDIFEIFTNYFFIYFDNNPMLGVKNIVDTSDDQYNEGFDFTFTSLHDKPGQIQSKWKSNPTHQFTMVELATNDSCAHGDNISKNNNILFINFDDTEKLFHYRYVHARKIRRVFDRKYQESYILRDPMFWDKIRECIDISTKPNFIEPFKRRDVQDWINLGVDKSKLENVSDEEIYKGTFHVVDGNASKGRVEAWTASGKTLAQFYDFIRKIENNRKNNITNQLDCVYILPTRSLITQQFKTFYKYKMFGEVVNDKLIDSNISCIIVMSGSKPKYDTLFNNHIIQTTNTKEILEFVKTEKDKCRNIIMFTTMKSQELKYEEIVNELQNNNIKIGLEEIDEYQNVITTSSERNKQEQIADYLRNNEKRCDCSIFYSASNKRGAILDSYDETLFGELLIKISREELRLRGYVAPKLIVKMVYLPKINIDIEKQRKADERNLNLESATKESIATIKAFNDLKKYYKTPNIILASSHVEGCRYNVYDNKIFKVDLPCVKNHIVVAETSNGDRDNIFETIDKSGDNILHQYSVVNEGISINNINGGLINRNMNIIGNQQFIGRSDRVIYDDTLKFQKGEISLDNPNGWDKYYNIIYYVIEEESIDNRFKQLISFLLDSGIPKDEWDISFVDDDSRKGSKSQDRPDSSLIEKIISDTDELNRYIEDTTLEIITEDENLILSQQDSKYFELSNMGKLEKLSNMFTDIQTKKQ